MITPKFKIWCKCAGIRALKTVAQTMIATIGTSVAIQDIDWLLVLSASAVSGLLSILTSIVTGLPEVEAEEKELELKETKRINRQDY